MLVMRRTFRRPSQSVLKSHLFSSKPDDENVDIPIPGLVPTLKKKAKAGQKTKNQTRIKQDMEGMNQKQQLDVLQQFYDASEAAKM